MTGRVVLDVGPARVHWEGGNGNGTVPIVGAFPHVRTASCSDILRGSLTRTSPKDRQMTRTSPKITRTLADTQLPAYLLSPQSPIPRSQVASSHLCALVHSVLGGGRDPGVSGLCDIIPYHHVHGLCPRLLPTTYQDVDGWCKACKLAPPLPGVATASETCP